MADEEMKPANQVKRTKGLGPMDVDPANYRSSMQCGCGMWRVIPKSVAEGDEFSLVPCPKCGWAPTLRYLGDCVELLDPAKNATYEGEVPVTPVVKSQVQ